MRLILNLDFNALFINEYKIFDLFFVYTNIYNHIHKK